MNMLKIMEENKMNPINYHKLRMLKSRSLINFVIAIIFQCTIIIFFLSCNDNSDILYSTSDDLLLKFSEYKELPPMYKNKIFQINGKIIHKNQAKDNMPLKNKSVIYFGELNDNNDFIWDKTICCFFDILTYNFVNTGDDVIIQGYIKEISSIGAIIFESCRFVKPMITQK